VNNNEEEAKEEGTSQKIQQEQEVGNARAILGRDSQKLRRVNGI